MKTGSYLFSSQACIQLHHGHHGGELPAHSFWHTNAICRHPVQKHTEQSFCQSSTLPIFKTLSKTHQWKICQGFLRSTLTVHVCKSFAVGSVMTIMNSGSGILCGQWWDFTLSPPSNSPLPSIFLFAFWLHSLWLAWPEEHSEVRHADFGVNNSHPQRPHTHTSTHPPLHRLATSSHSNRCYQGFHGWLSQLKETLTSEQRRCFMRLWVKAFQTYCVYSSLHFEKGYVRVISQWLYFEMACHRDVLETHCVPDASTSKQYKPVHCLL